MIKLDAEFLSSVGLDELPAWEKNAMLAHVRNTLRDRVGQCLAKAMTNSQLDEFDAYIKADDNEGALRWLEAAFPHYREVVASEMEGLKTEIRHLAPKIVEMSRLQDAANLADASS